MNLSILMFNAIVIKMIKKEYDSNVVYQAQVMIETEKRGFEVYKIKLAEGENLKEGDRVAIPVSFSVVNNTIYFSQNGKIQKTPA